MRTPEEIYVRIAEIDSLHREAQESINPNGGGSALGYCLEVENLMARRGLLHWALANYSADAISLKIAQVLDTKFKAEAQGLETSIKRAQCRLMELHWLQGREVNDSPQE